jgi:hypothetical protein
VLAAWANKQTMLAARAGYEKEEIPDRSGPVLIGRCETTLVVRQKAANDNSDMGPRAVEDRREFVAARRAFLTWRGLPRGFLLASLCASSFSRLTLRATLAFSNAAICLSVRGFLGGLGFSSVSSSSMNENGVPPLVLGNARPCASLQYFLFWAFPDSRPFLGPSKTPFLVQ